jgi:hypothetical protein
MTNPAPDRCCDESRENIPWYVNGTLSAPTAAALREHIKGCSDCQADLEIHTEMRASVLGRELTPMIPMARADDVIGINDIGLDRPSRARRASSRLIAAAAGIAVLGVALVLALYSGKDTELSNQLFQTATTAGSSEGIDYVLQLRFDERVSESEAGRITAELDGAIRWAVNDNGVYEVHVRLPEASLQVLQEYEEHAEALQGVQSAKFTALQLPIR